MLDDTFEICSKRASVLPYRDTNHAYIQYNTRSTDGDEDEKGYQGLIIKERKGGERSKTTTALSAIEVNKVI